jgi:hypothetical protein
MLPVSSLEYSCRVTIKWHVLRLLESSRGLTLKELMQELPADYPRHRIWALLRWPAFHS